MIDKQTFLTIVKNTPLVSIDMLLFDAEGRVLLGLRNNEPAKGTWFVPGGRINKDERFEQAFRRISNVETGTEIGPAAADFLGVYQHIYPDNAFLQPGVSTHYIVLAFHIQLATGITNLPQDQHSHYRWMSPEQLLQDPDVHPYTKVYFGENEALTLIVRGI